MNAPVAIVSWFDEAFFHLVEETYGDWDAAFSAEMSKRYHELVYRSVDLKVWHKK